jgi:hypothetical protein
MQLKQSVTFLIERGDKVCVLAEGLNTLAEHNMD